MPLEKRPLSSSLESRDRGYIRGEYLSQIDDSFQPFALWVPETYTAKKSYPLIVALHGADADERMIPEECLRIHERGFKEDICFLSPFGRGDLGFRWLGEADIWDAMRLIKSFYRIDARRQYLTGLSMGGYAAWRLAAEYPEQWAAVAPVCGGGSPEMARRLRTVPVWCVHGDRDPMVPVDESRRMMGLLQGRQKHARYTELSGWGHNSWEWLYQPGRRTRALVRWFLQFRKSRAAPAQQKPKRQNRFRDLFSERIVISYPGAAPIPRESDLLRSEAEAWAAFSFGQEVMRAGKLIVKKDSDLSEEELQEANQLMLGRTDNHVQLEKAGRKLLAHHRGGQLTVQGQSYLGKTLIGVTCQASPWNDNRLLGVITYQQFRQMRGLGEKIFHSHRELPMINVYDAEANRFLTTNGEES